MAGSPSPPIVVLIGLFIISITIKVIAYLSFWEFEVDLSRSNVDDSVGSVEERSSQDDGGLFFFYSDV
jgi:xanthosine utilization system XapX-like protein